MIDPNGDNIYSLLVAMGDGELDSTDSARLTQYLSCHPELVGWLEGQRSLTAAASRAVGDGPIAPESVRRRVEAMLHRSQASQVMKPDVSNQPIRVKRASFFLKVAAAAMIFLSIGILAGRYLLPDRSKVVTGQSSTLPAIFVAHASRVHADCSRLAGAQHAAAFPQGDLAVDVRRDLNSEHPYPNLESIGFRYVGAGPCGDPLQGAVHLLYRTTRPGSRAALSVFVERFQGQWPMQTNAVYSLTVPQSPFPVIAWRTDRVVYILVADDEKSAKLALDLIHGKTRGN